jgi:hypothetical protein
MNKVSSLPALLLLLKLLLLPLVLVWVPLMFAMAWVREALADLMHSAPLRAAPVLLSTHEQALASLRGRPRR